MKNTLAVEVAKNLLKIQAVFLKPNDPFTWASGIKSPIYCDNRLTLSYPKTRKVVEEGLAEVIKTYFPTCEVVKTYALNAKEAGLQGVVCSPLEAPIIKELGLISVTPGIRFADDSANDQKRIATPEFAKENGSTYIVVGRSITGASDPVAAYKKCVKEFC